MKNAIKPPKGKFAATAVVGTKGQIVIPKGLREMFDINPGDTLLVLGDTKRGIAIVKKDFFEHFPNGSKPEFEESEEEK